MPLPATIEDYLDLAMDEKACESFSLGDPCEGEEVFLARVEGYDVGKMRVEQDVLYENTVLFSISILLMTNYPNEIHHKYPAHFEPKQFKVPKTSPIYQSWMEAEAETTDEQKKNSFNPPKHYVLATSTMRLVEAKDMGPEIY